MVVDPILINLNSCIKTNTDIAYYNPAPYALSVDK